jgi:hypothetical protein
MQGMLCGRGALHLYTNTTYLLFCCHTRKCMHRILIAALYEVDIWLQISVMHTYKHQQERRSTQQLDQSLDHAMLGNSTNCRAMYGLKSSGVIWHAKLSETLYSIEFKPSYADPDVWMRATTKDDGFEYYEYILVYVNDLLVISHLPGPIMQTIQQAYRLKDDPSPPVNYLGATIKNGPSQMRPTRFGV